MLRRFFQSKWIAGRRFVVSFSMLLLSAGCAKPGEIVSPQNETDAVTSFQYEPLAWESSAHPERAGWSAALESLVDQHFSVLDQARDIATFCPNYSSLSHEERVNLWADVFAATAYFECSWNPASSSVDVGNQSNPDTWSVGLLQLSVVDQANYGFPFGYSYSDLKDPVKNLTLGVAIMAKQIAKKGKVLIAAGETGLYWATLHPGGKYDETAAIAKMTKKLSFCH